VVVLVGEVLFVVSEVWVQLEALFEVLDGFKTADILKEVKVTIGVHAGTDQSVPVDALQLDIWVVNLKWEAQSLVEVDVGTLYGVHVFSCRFELVEVEVFGEHFHLNKLIIIMSHSNFTKLPAALLPPH